MSAEHEDELAAVAEAEGQACVDVGRHDAVERRAALDEKLGSLGRLAAGVAHELNNPLAWMIAALEHIRTVLRSRHGDADLLDPIDEALEGASRMRRIVAALHAGVDDTSVELTAVDVAASIESALKLAAHALKPRADVTVEIEPHLPAVVADARLTQVLLSVLLNAGDACSQHLGGRIVVGARRSGEGRVVVEVADNGRGMEEATARQAFDPFFTTREGKGGTGLGLWISRSSVESFGGTLQLRSALGAGTVVEIVLPISHPDRARDPSRRPSPPVEKAPDRLRVLVVDDEPLVARALERILKDLHEVVVEHGARGALDRIAAGERFDVVISDLTMPGMDGIDFFVTAETLDEGLSGRVIVITGGTSLEIERAVRARQIPMLGKPFQAVGVRRAVGEFKRRADG